MDPRFLVEAGALGLFVWYSLRLSNQHQRYIKSRDLIIAEIFASQSERDKETRSFWLQMRAENNSTLADNTAVIHQAIEAMNRNNEYLKDLNR